MSEHDSYNPETTEPNDASAWAFLGLLTGAIAQESFNFERNVEQPVQALKDSGTAVQNHISRLTKSEGANISLPGLVAVSAGVRDTLNEPHITRREMLALMGGFTLSLICGAKLTQNQYEDMERGEISQTLREQVIGIEQKLAPLFMDVPFDKENALFIIMGGASDSALLHHEWWQPFEREWRINNNVSAEAASQAHDRMHAELEISLHALTPKDQEIQYYQTLWKEGIFLMPWWLVEGYDCLGMSILTAAIMHHLPADTKITIASHSMGAVSTRLLLNFIEKGYAHDLVDPKQIERAVLVADPFLGNIYYDTHLSVKPWDDFVGATLQGEKDLLYKIQPHIPEVQMLYRSNDIGQMVHRMLSLHPELIAHFDANKIHFPVISVRDEGDVIANYSRIPGSREVLMKRDGDVFVNHVYDEAQYDLLPDQFSFITSPEARKAHERLPATQESQLIFRLR